MPEENVKTAVLVQGVNMDFRTVYEESSQTFKNNIGNMQSDLQQPGFPPIDLMSVCRERNSYLGRTKTQYEQPAIFAVSVAQMMELQETPDVLIGHSFGEYAALWKAQVFTRKNGFLITRMRGILTRQANRDRPGLMAAVSGELDVSKIRRICRNYGIDIANINSPAQLVVSGEERQIQRSCREFEDMGLHITFLDTGCAFHSRHLESIQPQFRSFLDTIPFEPPKIPVIMNATAQPETDPEKIKDCLANQLTDPVNFPEIVETMNLMGVQKIHEIGARNILTSFVKKILRKS